MVTDIKLEYNQAEDTLEALVTREVDGITTVSRWPFIRNVEADPKLLTNLIAQHGSWKYDSITIAPSGTYFLTDADYVLDARVGGIGAATGNIQLPTLVDAYDGRAFIFKINIGLGKQMNVNAFAGDTIDGGGSLQFLSTQTLIVVGDVAARAWVVVLNTTPPLSDAPTARTESTEYTYTDFQTGSTSQKITPVFSLAQGEFIITAQMAILEYFAGTGLVSITSDAGLEGIDDTILWQNTDLRSTSGLLNNWAISKDLEGIIIANGAYPHTAHDVNITVSANAVLNNLTAGKIKVSAVIGVA